MQFIKLIIALNDLKRNALGLNRENIRCIGSKSIIYSFLKFNKICLKCTHIKGFRHYWQIYIQVKKIQKRRLEKYGIIH
jgi:hypothetical protein